MRAFVSIDISGKVAEKISEIQNELPEFYGKITGMKNLHLTLKFLGDIDEETIDKVKVRLRNIKFRKFPVAIDEVGVFSEKFVRIIWVRINDCGPLQKAIDEALGDLFPPETRFMSHLTVARVKGVKNKEEFLKKINAIKVEPLKLMVSGFELKESILGGSDPEYKTVEEFHLSEI